MKMNAYRTSVILRKFLRRSGISGSAARDVVTNIDSSQKTVCSFYQLSRHLSINSCSAVGSDRKVLRLNLCCQDHKLRLFKGDCHQYHQIRGIRVNALDLAFKKPEKDDDDILGKGEKVIKVNLSMTRLDVVIKAGLGYSKNKIEKLIYDDRVRVNGERPKKKSERVFQGDEIDVVRGYSKLNRDFLEVARVEIVKLVHPDDAHDSDSEDEKSFKVPATLRRSKTLTIQNYSPKPWKGTDMEN